MTLEKLEKMYNALRWDSVLFVLELKERGIVDNIREAVCVDAPLWLYLNNNNIILMCTHS